METAEQQRDRYKQALIDIFKESSYFTEAYHIARDTLVNCEECDGSGFIKWMDGDYLEEDNCSHCQGIYEWLEKNDGKKTETEQQRIRDIDPRQEAI